MTVNAINSVNGLEVQYYEIVNADTLQSVTSWDDAEHIQGCITVFCGATPIRLIDNINYK
jgi:pantoate--beta-alanine ligase